MNSRLHQLTHVSLYLTAPANILVGYSLAFPESAPARFIALPSSDTSLYTLLAGVLVALFGVAYWLMARQSVINRSLLLLGATGKSIAALLAIFLFVSGQLSTTTLILLQGDLLLAGLWFTYLWQGHHG